MTRKIFLTILLTLFFTKAYADPPFMSDSPETLAPGKSNLILYGSGNWSKTVNTIVAPALEVDYGVIPNLEIDGYFPILRNYDADAGVKQQFPNDSGLGDIDIEIKYRFFQETPYLPEIGFIPNIYLPTGNSNRGLGNGRIWYTLPLSFQKSWGSLSTYLELGYGINSAPNNANYFFGGWVITKQINPLLNLGAEIYTQREETIYSPSFTVLNLGGTYQISSHFNFLAGVGHNIIGQKYWAGYIGLAWS